MIHDIRLALADAGLRWHVILTERGTFEVLATTRGEALRFLLDWLDHPVETEFIRRPA